MDSVSLNALVEEHLAAARSARAGRSAHTVHGGHEHLLRQTLIAMVAGIELAEHNSPGQATLQVLRGRVRMTTVDEEWSGAAGDFVIIPRQRHALHADEDSAVLLTVLADS